MRNVTQEPALFIPKKGRAVSQAVICRCLSEEPGLYQVQSVLEFIRQRANETDVSLHISFLVCQCFFTDVLQSFIYHRQRIIL